MLSVHPSPTALVVLSTTSVAQAELHPGPQAKSLFQFPLTIERSLLNSQPQMI